MASNGSENGRVPRLGEGANVPGDLGLVDADSPSEDELLEFELDEDDEPPILEQDNLLADWDLLSSEAVTSQSMASANSTSIGPGNYEVKQGDCISSVAYRAGFFPDTIWHHPENAELKRERTDPNVLLPGDVVVVPVKTLRHEPGDTEQRHRFRRKGVPERLHVQLLQLGQPRANVEYILDLDGKTHRGNADDMGWINHPIVPNASIARLIVDPGPEQDEYDIVIGGVDPKDTVTGVQERLSNLGYDCFITGALDGRTKAALREFQETHGLEVSGEPDAKTTDALEQAAVDESEKT